MKQKKDLTKLRLTNLGGSLIGFILTFFIASRALDTASWWEYSATLILLIFSINRFIRIFAPIKK
ncbi:MAG: hypothetical protein WCI37_02190 [bacterium]